MSEKVTYTVSLEKRPRDRSAAYWGDRHPFLHSLALLGLLGFALGIIVILAALPQVLAQ